MSESNEGEGFWSRLTRGLGRKTAPPPPKETPINEELETDTAQKITGGLRAKRYQGLYGPSDQTARVVDKVFGELSEDCLALRIAVTSEISGSKEVLAALDAQAPEDYELTDKEKASSIGTIQKMQLYLTRIAQTSTKPVIVIVEDVNNFEGTSGDSTLQAIRFLRNNRAGKPLLENLTFLVTSTEHPSKWVKDKLTTPFNVLGSEDIHKL